MPISSDRQITHRQFFRTLTSRALDRTLKNSLERRNDGLFFGIEINEALAETAAVIARRDPKQLGRVHFEASA
jgi:hypothetical protein